MFGSFKKESRLVQWTGRRRSSRSEAPIWTQLSQPWVLVRLAFVLATMFVVTCLAYRSGLTLRYRVGETPRANLRARVAFSSVNEPQTELAREEAAEKQGSDPLARAAARQAVSPIVEHYPAGTPIVPVGTAVTPARLLLLQQEHAAYLNTLTWADHVRRGVALFLVMSLLAGVVALYVSLFQPALAESRTKIAAVCLLALCTIWLSLVISGPPWHATLLPLTITAMILTIAYNPQLALLMSFSLALAVTVSLGGDLEHLLVQMAGMATAVLLLRNVRSRTWLVRVGLGAGLAYLAMTVATGFLTGQASRFIAFEAGRQFVIGSLAGFLLTGCLPLVERAFGVITDISLLDYADSTHPLLQELIKRAPGTYTHSMTVALLAEAAAEAIGANPVLARVGSYFHDIGKMLKPEYFVENQQGNNRHDALEPALSRLVIIGHVKDGVALARQYNLPRPIIDFVQQHHGTTLVEYFYWEAMKLQEQAGSPVVELEPEFRYPGPKPQSPENGIVMMADAAESASRALKDPSPGSVKKLVHDLMMKRLLDGQFEESGLTLTDLHQIEESLGKSLIALFHSRIHYPGEATDSAVARRAS